MLRHSPFFIPLSVRKNETMKKEPGFNPVPF